ncbi:hypothetical protein N9H60_03225 [Flavimaricola sp.]|nr:hypothetical protein [Flavimaricola sp.]MDA9020171.1 hypothetical protein [Flavimaricola sp.]
MIRKFAAITFAGALLAACAETSVMQMSQDTFRVQTNAAPACGPTGARNLAYRAAATEVIRKGGDLYIIGSDQSDTGMTGDIFSGFYQNYSQGIVVRMIDPNSPDARNALSARETLGPEWQTLLAEGVPNTCT